jgi:carboxyl-terminal processing protease
MSMRSRTLATLGAGIILGLAAALAGNAMAGRQSDEAEAPAPATLPWEEARLFAEVYERIKRDYVDEVDNHELMEKAVRGMVAALDPHSAFLDSEEFEEIRLSTMGSYRSRGRGRRRQNSTPHRGLASRTGGDALRRFHRKDRRSGCGC